MQSLPQEKLTGGHCELCCIGQQGSQGPQPTQPHADSEEGRGKTSPVLQIHWGRIEEHNLSLRRLQL